MTKNSFVSQAVLWSGCVLSLLGLFFDQSKTVCVTGLTIGSSGMVQSYYGSVFEIERSKRFWYHLVGVPLALGLGYVALLSLKDNLTSWLMISVVVASSVIIQVIISLVANHFWILQHPSDKTSFLD